MSIELPYAWKVENRISDASDNAAGNEKFDSVTNQTYIVPTGKRWILLGGSVYRDASETLAVYLQDSTGDSLHRILNSGASTGWAPYPDTYHEGVEFYLDPGERVDITFGGNQGAGAIATCIVLEIDIQ